MVVVHGPSGVADEAVVEDTHVEADDIPELHRPVAGPELPTRGMSDIISYCRRERKNSRMPPPRLRISASRTHPKSTS